MGYPTREEILKQISTLSDLEITEIYARYFPHENEEEAKSVDDNDIHTESSPFKDKKSDRIVKVVDKVEDSRECPFCKASSILKNGCRKDMQRYKCKACGKSFTITTHNILSASHQSVEVWKDVLEDTLSGQSIDDTAERLGLSHQCVFFMRHKILMAMEKVQEDEPTVLGNVTEMDETYVLESRKGNEFDDDSDRPPRKRGSKASKRGLSDEQICVCTGIERGGKSYLRTVNRAKPSNHELETVFSGHLEEGTMCLTDGLKGYKKVGSKLGCQVVDATAVHENPKEGEKAFFHINNVNSIHSSYKTMYHRYRGVATKYINRYNTMFGYSYKITPEEIDELWRKILDVRLEDWSVTIEETKSKGLLHL